MHITWLPTEHQQYFSWELLRHNQALELDAGSLATFSTLKDVDQWDHPIMISVTVTWTPHLEYKYRYLIAADLDKGDYQKWYGYRLEDTLPTLSTILEVVFSWISYQRLSRTFRARKRRAFYV